MAPQTATQTWDLEKKGRWSLGGLQFLRYLFASFSSFFADFLALSFLVHVFSWHHLPSVVLSFFVGTTTKYALSTTWVFSQHRFQKRPIEFAFFGATSLCLLGFQVSCMFFLVDILHFQAMPAKLCSGGLGLVVGYLLRKKLLFETPKPRPTRKEKPLTSSPTKDKASSSLSRNLFDKVQETKRTRDIHVI